jgi:uncharacterized protein (TIGR03437 family)
VNNRPATGDASPSDPLATTVASPTLTVGGVMANISTSALEPGAVGLYRVSFHIPDGAPSGDAIPIVLTIGGINSSTATIAVQ